MRALLIYDDGRAEVLEGSFGDELTLITVLTQAALAALEESAIHSRLKAPDSVQMNLGDCQVTLLRCSESRWLRLEHDAEITMTHLQAWAIEHIPSSPVAPVMTGRVPSLMEALNVTSL